MYESSRKPSVEWNERVAREADRQASIEEAFDWAEDCERRGDLRHALEWLERAEQLSGGLSPAGETQRARWMSRLSRHRSAGERVAVLIPGGLDAPAVARQVVTAMDGDWPAGVRADVLLLVTELVANAVIHPGAGPTRPVRVELCERDGRVHVDVKDSGPRFARLALRPDRGERGGWGLFLLDRIADRWGVTHAAPGTRIWFEIRCGPG
jgi:Histidine kinase-like ATPase domain